MRKQAWLALACLAAGTTWGGSAAAQDTSGRVQLSVDEYLYLHESLTITPEGARSWTVDHSAFGLVPSAFGLAAGYGLGSSVAVGGRLAFSNDHSDAGDTSATSLLPFVELSLGTSSVQPTLALIVGYRTYVEEPDQGEKLTSRAFALGASGGVRLFASRDFSVGPFAQVLYQTGSGEAGSSEAKFKMVAVMAGFSLTGWLGTPAGASSAPPVNELDPTEPADLGASPRPPTDPAQADAETYTGGPAPKVSEDGKVEMRFPIMGGASLRLFGHPAKDAAGAWIELTVPGARERLASCTQLALETGESTLPTEGASHAESGDGSAAVLRAKVPLATLTAFGQAGQTAVVACEDDFKLEAGHRRHVARFIEVFQARAGK